MFFCKNWSRLYLIYIIQGRGMHSLITCYKKINPYLSSFAKAWFKDIKIFLFFSKSSHWKIFLSFFSYESLKTSYKIRCFLGNSSISRSWYDTWYLIMVWYLIPDHGMIPVRHLQSVLACLPFHWLSLSFRYTPHDSGYMYICNTYYVYLIFFSFLKKTMQFSHLLWSTGTWLILSPHVYLIQS